VERRITLKDFGNLGNADLAEQRGRTQPGGVAALRQSSKFKGFSAMMRRCAAIVLLAFSLLGLAVPLQAAAEDPRSFINMLGERALQVLGPSVSPAQRLARFRELFSTDFDVPGIGRFVLGRYWHTATPQEQQEFLSLFQEYVARAYSARLGGFGGVPFRVTGSRSQGAETVVNSEIILASGPIKLDWYVVHQDGRYKITDIYIAGVSMKVTQRDEFAAVIQRSGGRVEGLLLQLREKLSAG
jgi:phospholipid transport system substrate-binding protein